MFRFIAIAAALIVVAVAAPKFAPGLLANALRSDVAEESAAPPAPHATTAAEQKERIRPPGGHRTTIPADGNGHFYVKATVNGRSVEAVVDTGATTVALTAETARRLGIVPPQSAYTTPISTANGVTRAAPVMLNEIRLGRISVRNVEAFVIPGDALAINLLGMTFLNRLTKFESAGGQLVLFE